MPPKKKQPPTAEEPVEDTAAGGAGATANADDEVVSMFRGPSSKMASSMGTAVKRMKAATGARGGARRCRGCRGVALRTKEKMLNAEGGRAFASLDIEAKVTGMDANGSNALIDCGTPGEWYLLPSREVKPLSSASASALDGVDSASDAGGFGRPFDGGFGGSQYGGMAAAPPPPGRQPGQRRRRRGGGQYKAKVWETVYEEGARRAQARRRENVGHHDHAGERPAAGHALLLGGSARAGGHRARLPARRRCT